MTQDALSWLVYTNQLLPPSCIFLCICWRRWVGGRGWVEGGNLESFMLRSRCTFDILTRFVFFMMVGAWGCEAASEAISAPKHSSLSTGAHLKHLEGRLGCYGN